ncbi:hypothetical protein [Streptomyces spongiae]|uniref:hypothetical protein n=1 Tax=Streptomyces spongiae TaxID=565072 RepID=UPI00389AC181
MLDGGMTEREAAWTVWAVSYFTLGLTQEEQAVPVSGGDRVAQSVSGTSHPSLHRVLAHLDAGSFDERFEFGVRALIGRGARA